MNVDGTTVAPPKNASESLIALVNRQVKEIEKALPKHVTAERLTRIAITAIRKNPKLAECSKASFLGSLMLAAQLGLEPNSPLGHAYLIPYKNECTFQLGYQGLLDLAYRTGQFRRIEACAVYEGDAFEYCYGTEQRLYHKPAWHEPDEVPVAFYALYELINGGTTFTVSSYDEIFDHAKKYSKSWDAMAKSFKSGSAWATAFNGMAKKTVLAALLKYAPKSAELQQAMASDEARVSMRADDDVITLEADLIGGEEASA